jgi:L-threonylcarbamoyladenylate synthase
VPKAVFLDRDGTLIKDRGHLDRPSQAVFFPDTFDALRRLQEEFLLFIVTHQSGIAKRLITRRDADRVNDSVVRRLAEAGVYITDVYVCPHDRAEGCSCVKPKGHFPEMAAARYGVDLTRSFTVGDHPHDVTLADSVGARGIYVLTGHGKKHRDELPPGATVTRGIREAAEHILSGIDDSTETDGSSDPLVQAAAALRNGGLVAFPTETVYGLGANALDAKAVARIFEVKRRPRFDPLIVHVASLAEARGLTREWPDAATELACRFWPGPLTLVLPKATAVPDIVTSGLPTVALRMPDHPLALGLFAEARVPVAAPSANRFGSISPTRAEHVRNQLGGDVDLVLDGGPCRVGVESTIVSLASDGPALLRAGGTPVEQIERIVGSVRRPGADPEHPTAPGQCPRHYAPRTPLVFCEERDEPPVSDRAGLLTLRRPLDAERFAAVEVLAENGELQEAAANLFAALHRLDAAALDVIVATKVPEAGLGLAINDRLHRAAHGTL